ncbi:MULTISPECIES: DUF3761 domain-containing protein [unclassified Streptomyces]|uniref:DUF3761 domain-containing protein n=1 Tax=unclassified Streptomyces TaxID=2593676 RepID=UPI0008882F97|nr:MULTISPECIES: DUF3761 domain-containing protein [unclassified Streptomyces]PBC81172.1 uncharacterized protein DUF3761 [Streptomyces sp. 2321.6]SDR56131.1 Protein of unknown function [Streptomyces sp. KS_16]SEC04165.1 Protein of unknown function [Streptomyces sp. 2133.1]SNC64079.1 Protein of unknown function [Streptomyces sp. 2114.4]
MTGNQGPMSPEDKKNARLGCAVIAVFVLLVGGCVNLMDGDGERKSSAATSVSDASGGGSDASGSRSDASDGEGDTLTVPDYTGRNLQEAQDAAQRRGISVLKSRDLSTRKRLQVWDRNWQVCDQEPAAGSVMHDTETLTFAVVKADESCDEPDAAGSTSGTASFEPTEEPTDAEETATADGSATTDGSASSGGSASGGSTSSGGSGTDGGGSSGGSSSSGGAGSGSGSSSTSGGGGQEQAPAGASAQCNDGTYSYSAHRRGTCSHHHGVAVWLRSLPA